MEHIVNYIYLFIFINALIKVGKSWPLHNKKDPIDKDMHTENMTHHFHMNNYTDGQFIWEGGSYPYQEPDYDEGREFYEKAILIAPIVGSIFLVIIVATGIYALRRYGNETVEIPQNRVCRHHHTHDCKNVSQARVFGEKMRYYMSKLWDNSNKSNAMFVKMEDRTRLLFGLKKTETVEMIV